MFPPSAAPAALHFLGNLVGVEHRRAGGKRLPFQLALFLRKLQNAFYPERPFQLLRGIHRRTIAGPVLGVGLPVHGRPKRL